MALLLSITTFKGHPMPLPRPSSSIPPPLRTTTRYAAPRYPPAIVSSASSPIKIVRCPALDRHVSKHGRLRFVRKLTALLLSKPRGFLPLRVLSRCRAYLSPPRRRSILSMICRYPSVFRLFYAPSHTAPSLSLLAVALTPAAASLAADEARLRAALAPALAAKLHRLLMLAAPHHRLLLSDLAHLAPDLGLPRDFRSVLCHAYPTRFRAVATPLGRALELISPDPSLAVALPPRAPPSSAPSIIDRPPRFPRLQLRRGLNLKRRHRDYLLRLQALPEADPYSPPPPGAGLEAVEKRACMAVREVLGMTVERRTLVDHLTHLRRELGLPNRLRAMLARHPEMFYVSVRGQRDSVFLVEAYDDKGRLLPEEELLGGRDKLAELVREGKRMRREWRMGLSYDDIAGSSNDDDDDDDDNQEEEDGVESLLENSIGDGWEELEMEDIDEEDGGDIGEFWVKTASGEALEAW